MSGLLTGAMALIICISTAGTALAADEPLPDGAPENPVGAAITKVLQMPQGTTIPTATFTFDIQKVSIDGDVSAAAIVAMPELTGSITVNDTSDNILDGDKKIVTKNTGDLLVGRTWPHAGEYIYKVTEAANSYIITDANKETLTYSQAKYELHVYIAEAADGSLYVKSAGAVIIKDQNNSTGGAGEKVDPSVPATEAEGNNFKFVNTYIKTPGGGEAPNPDTQSMAISKAVSGALASKTKYFPFEVTITNNTLISAAGYYNAYICTLSGGTYTKVSDAEADNQYDTGRDYVSFTTGTMQEITLKHGQYLVFMDCPQGTVYSVTERAVSGYIAAVHLVTGGTAINPDLANTTANTALSTGDRIVTASGANSAAFTNTYATTVPTGIIIDNLPFIVMILSGIGAFTAFIVNKRRKMVR